jgi:hypothetical protein
MQDINDTLHLAHSERAPSSAVCVERKRYDFEFEQCPGSIPHPHSPLFPPKVAMVTFEYAELLLPN